MSSNRRRGRALTRRELIGGLTGTAARGAGRRPAARSVVRPGWDVMSSRSGLPILHAIGVLIFFGKREPFVDPETSGFCRWIEELANSGGVAGCGGGKYCPTAAVSRKEMSVFLTVAFGLTLYGL